MAAAALLLAVVAGCGGRTAAAPSAAESRAADLTSVPARAIPSEPTAATQREATSPDPAFDYGFVVQITPSGFHPQVLVAACCRPILWMNLTNGTNSVVFDVDGVRSGPIPSGGSWLFTPANAESIAYHSGTYRSMSGAVQVNQTSD